MKELFELGTQAKGDTPMASLSDEAVTLLVACNSIMTALAMQGAPIPGRLQSDLMLFCRQNTGFLVPIEMLAKEHVDIGNPANSPARQMCHVAMGINNKAALIQNECHMLRDEATDDAARLLAHLGMMELELERLYQFFGWSKQLVRMAARAELDRQPPKLN